MIFLQLTERGGSTVLVRVERISVITELPGQGSYVHTGSTAVVVQETPDDIKARIERSYL